MTRLRDYTVMPGEENADDFSPAELTVADTYIIERAVGRLNANDRLTYWETLNF